MKTKLFLLALVLTATKMFSANVSNSVITGRVTNDENQPIASANVVLCSKLDSKVITGTITNEKGEYSFKQNVSDDVYVQISYMGYETQTIAPENGQTVTLNFGNILLDEIIVQAGAKIHPLQKESIAANTGFTVPVKENNLSDIFHSSTNSNSQIDK